MKDIFSALQWNNMRFPVASIFNRVIPQQSKSLSLSVWLKENVIRIRFKNFQKIPGFYDLICHGIRIVLFFFFVHFWQPAMDVIPGGNIWHARYRDGMRIVRMHVRVVRHVHAYQRRCRPCSRENRVTGEWHPFQTGPQEQITPILRTPACTHTQLYTQSRRPLYLWSENLQLPTIWLYDFMHRRGDSWQILNSRSNKFIAWMLVTEYHVILSHYRHKKFNLLQKMLHNVIQLQEIQNIFENLLES